MKKIMLMVVVLATISLFAACQKYGVFPEPDFEPSKASIAVTEPVANEVVGAGDSINVAWVSKKIPKNAVIILQLINTNNASIVAISPASAATVGVVTVNGITYSAISNTTLSVHVALPGTAILNLIGYGNIYKIRACIVDGKHHEIITFGDSGVFTIHN